MNSRFFSGRFCLGGFSRGNFVCGGFSLVELLVVVGVLSILTVVFAVPAVGSSKREARLESARATCKTLSDAMLRTKILAPERWSDTVPGAVAVTGGLNTEADKNAAVTFYLDNGLIQDWPKNYDDVEWVGGEWRPVVD